MLSAAVAPLTVDEIRLRLNNIDSQMLSLLAERSGLVREVGKIKHAQGKSLQASDREAAMFARMHAQCTELCLNFDFIAELWSTMIYYSKVMECEEVGIDSFLETKTVPALELRRNLIDLTELTAVTYDDYCNGDGANAVRAYRSRERHVILRAMSHGLPGYGLALDLGCATGQVAEMLEPHFEQVEGYDVSPFMCGHARERRCWSGHVSFEEADLEAGIPARDSSVDFIVANFGSASELGPGLLAEIRRVLKTGGKAVLSYYNRDALLNYWFYPWPSTVKARLNRHNGTLEVWTHNRVFTVQAAGKTVGELDSELRGNGLRIVDRRIETYPTLQAIVPRFFFSSSHADAGTMARIAEEIDAHLARSRSGLYRGTYIVAEVQKQ